MSVLGDELLFWEINYVSPGGGIVVLGDKLLCQSSGVNYQSCGMNYYFLV